MAYWCVSAICPDTSHVCVSIQFAHLHGALLCNTELINDATIHLCLTCCTFCRFCGSATACIKFITGPSFFAAVFSFWRLLEEFAHNSIWRVECFRRTRRLRQRPKAVAMQLFKKKKTFGLILCGWHENNWLRCCAAHIFYCICVCHSLLRDKIAARRGERGKSAFR